MKFNILNFILTHSSGLILLGNPDMERREAYRFLDGPDCGERAGVRRSFRDKRAPRLRTDAICPAGCCNRAFRTQAASRTT
jgi:hypothetical protein